MGTRWSNAAQIREVLLYNYTVGLVLIPCVEKCMITIIMLTEENFLQFHCILILLECT